MDGRMDGANIIYSCTVIMLKGSFSCHCGLFEGQILGFHKVTGESLHLNEGIY